MLPCVFVTGVVSTKSSRYQKRLAGVYTLKLLSILLSSFLLMTVIACQGDNLTKEESFNNPCESAYGEPESSQDVIPWQIGESYTVLQANCGSPSHSEQNMLKFAYDFTMPINTPVTAMRAGVVELIIDFNIDNTGVPGEENFIMIRHEDQTLGRYFHFTQFGTVVNVGDFVVQGELIGFSGNTGQTSGFPHLHVDIKTNCSASRCPSLPLVFKNVSGMDNPLVISKTYMALGY